MFTKLFYNSQVDHPNCIRLYDVYITPRKVYIVTELVTGGELLDRCVFSSLGTHATIRMLTSNMVFHAG